MSDLLAALRERLGEAVTDSHEHRGDTTILVQKEQIHQVLAQLRDDSQFAFNVLSDLTAVDYLGREPRFEVVYHLFSVSAEPTLAEPSALRRRVRVKACVSEQDCVIASVSDLWASANWMEREVWDMYGVSFSGHPELRRILLYDEFEGHPLRKDYPKERRQPLVGPRN